MIADTSCSPNVSTDKSASGLKNPASRFEKPAFVVASFLLQPSIHQDPCAAASSLGTSPLHPLSQAKDHAPLALRMCPSAFCKPPNSDKHLSPPTSSHLNSKALSLSPISPSPFEPGSLENHSAHARCDPFPQNSNN